MIHHLLHEKIILRYPSVITEIPKARRRQHQIVIHSPTRTRSDQNLTQPMLSTWEPAVFDLALHAVMCQVPRKFYWKWWKTPEQTSSTKSRTWSAPRMPWTAPPRKRTSTSRRTARRPTAAPGPGWSWSAPSSATASSSVSSTPTACSTRNSTRSSRTRAPPTRLAKQVRTEIDSKEVLFLDQVLSCMYLNLGINWGVVD